MVVVRQVHPNVALVRFALFENEDARVVRVDSIRPKRRLGHRVRDGPEDVGELLDPIAHRRACNVHLIARDALCDAVQGLVVVVFADDDVREKPRPREPPLDDSVGHRRYHDAFFFACARVLHARGLYADEGCWPVVELLRRLLADDVHRFAAARASTKRLRRINSIRSTGRCSGSLPRPCGLLGRFGSFSRALFSA